MIKKAIDWFLGFFEDQNGSASSKRLIAYIGMYFLYMIVKKSLKGGNVDFNVLLVVAGLVLFGLGAITAEFFKEKLSK